MCGLVAVMSKKKKPIGSKVFQLYTAQKKRGQQGFGYVAIDNGKVVSVVRGKYESDIKDALLKEQAEIILFHHRFPTSTKNTQGTTHPMFVSNPELKYDYYFAHNGVITNSLVLKAKHEKLGYVYTTEFMEKITAVYKDGREEYMDSEQSVFNDSESLAIELARYIEELDTDVNTKGGVAFWGVSMIKGTNKVHRIYYGKNKGRDLKFTKSRKWFAITSETGSDISDMLLHSIDLKKADVLTEELRIDTAEERQVGSHWNAGFQRRLPTPDYDEREESAVLRGQRMAQTYAQNSLLNKYYTYDEACDTGVPIAEFFSVRYGHISYWVPIKYKAYTSGRLNKNLPTHDELFPALITAGAKEYEQLEELVVKIASLESTIEEMESDVELCEHYGVSEQEAQNEIDKKQTELDEIEASLAGLGISEGIIEERLSLARELEGINKAFYGS